MEIKKDSVILRINPKLYNLEAVYSASYVFLDKVYVMLDGDLKKEIQVILMPKKKTDLKKLGGEFYNELINYSDYQKRSEKTVKVREMILQRSLFTNDPQSIRHRVPKEWSEEIGEDNYKDDPKGIMIPWEEKHKTTDK